MSLGRYLALLMALVALIGCGSATPSARVEVSPTHASPPSTSSPTLLPTADRPAPERTFAKVGSVARLEGEHDISGKAVVAGLQTLIIQSFTFDGKGPAPEIRLAKGDEYAEPAAVLLRLEPRAYRGETLMIRIPASLAPGSADGIAVYCPEANRTYAAAAFE